MVNMGPADLTACRTISIHLSPQTLFLLDGPVQVKQADAPDAMRRDCERLFGVTEGHDGTILAWGPTLVPLCLRGKYNKSNHFEKAPYTSTPWLPHRGTITSTGYSEGYRPGSPYAL
jgi:hypothetical protein